MAVLIYLAVLLPFAVVFYFLPRQQMAARRKYVQALKQRIHGSSDHASLGKLSEMDDRRWKSSLLYKLILLIEGGGFSASQARGILLAMAGMILLLFIVHIVPLFERILTPGMNLLLFVATGSLPGFVAYRIIRQRQEFARQLPDAIEAMVRALEAGNSIEEAMHVIATEFPPPVSGEFQLITRQLKIGLSFKEALINLRDRLPLPEVQYLVLALIIQRDTGGHLARILTHLTALMRRRLIFDGKLKALTAETRFTALFISGLPLIYIGYRYFFKRAEMHFFLSDPTGVLILQISLGLIITGSFILKYMLRIRF